MEALRIEGFRNFGTVCLRPGPGINVIYGDNAQGKTNLLEALWLFCGARSFRGAREAEMVGVGGENAKLHLEFFGGERSQTADIYLGGEKKRVLLNEIPLERISALAGSFCVVVFSPDQLAMVKGGPEGRRKFLDVSLCQILPQYGKALENYERVLRQRAHLLKDSAYHSGMDGMIEVWDNHLVRYGAYIMRARARYVAKLDAAARGIYKGITRGREKLAASYKNTAARKGTPDERADCEKAFFEALQRSRSEDMRVGATTVGPHRDDLDIQVDAMSARSYASQGQQRSCVLALKLAECEILGSSVGEPPVVLLDDVMSELDEGRRAYLLNHLAGRQVFITCCDTSLFEGLEQGAVFQVRKGKITKKRRGL